MSIISLLLLVAIVAAVSRGHWWGVAGNIVMDKPTSPQPVSDDRRQAVAAIVAQMQAQGITMAELSQAMGGKPPREKGEVVTHLFSILGGIFVFAGIGVYIAMFWKDMNSAMHILVTLGVGWVIQAISLLMLSQKRYVRMVNPLLLIAVVLQTTGWFVAIDELLPHGNEPRYAVLFVMAVMGVQQAAIFARWRLTPLLFFVFCFAYGFLFTLFDLMHADEKWVMVGLGVSMMALAQGIRPTPHHVLSSMGYFLGGVMFYTGLFDILRYSPIELIYLGATCGLIYVSTLVRSSALLTVSVIAMLSYIGYFTEEHFVHSVGWPLSLVLLGIIFFALGGFALKVKRQYIN